MKRKSYHDIRMWLVFLTWTGIALMFPMLSGCASGNYGTMRWDRDLNNMFENYQVLPDHTYYVTGGYNAPAAILALQKEYQLENDAGVWVQVPDVNENLIKRWVENLSRDMTFWQNNQFAASYIYDPQGKRVGAWYSGKKTTTVKFLEDNRIKVYPPDMQPSITGGGQGKGFMIR
jgi:hypothetical protein